ncbi:MAG: alpha/beta fold hydrolase [Herminiimonas sp.]|uniref:alpha/beta hydrolase n=1 Tax=Herminiimonas sp. TaxID=1926289 RepID=UPI0027232C2A|nr:alpha/beta fold hydrolase [Herminiimonas sp.]MDO9420610.1 alpha/beta fold hydrolase [Herminiimonas sp.]
MTNETSIHAEEFWTTKNGVKLWVYRKYLGARDEQRPLLFLVHGSSYSGKTMFDLHVPGRSGYSFMDNFVALGYEVWTMDHEGYGHSDRTSGFSDVASGVEDLKAAMGVITEVTGQTEAAFFGQSSGALRAAKFTNVYPEHVSKLMLDAFVWTGKDAPTLIQRAKLLPLIENSNVRKIDVAFYRTVFTRDHVGSSEAMIGDVVAEEELKYGDTVPTGTYLDMVTKLPLIDPDKITCPVLIIRAEHDGIATEEDVINFFSCLPNPDKQLVKISGLAHTAPLGVNRHRFYHAIQSFLTMPDRIDLNTNC